MLVIVQILYNTMTYFYKGIFFQIMEMSQYFHFRFKNVTINHNNVYQMMNIMIFYKVLVYSLMFIKNKWIFIILIVSLYLQNFNNYQFYI